MQPSSSAEVYNTNTTTKLLYVYYYFTITTAATTTSTECFSPQLADSTQVVEGVIGCNRARQAQYIIPLLQNYFTTTATITVIITATAISNESFSP